MLAIIERGPGHRPWPPRRGLTPATWCAAAPKAPITIIEYASVGCPHCAALHTEVFPAFKAKYIDTGKVRWVAREALAGDQYLATARLSAGSCAGKDHYFDVTDAIYKDQAKIYGDLHTGLLAVAKSVGMTEDQFNACLKDKANLDALDARMALDAADNIDPTPTLFVNGRRMNPNLEVTLPLLEKAVAEAGKAQGQVSLPNRPSQPPRKRRAEPPCPRFRILIAAAWP